MLRTVDKQYDDQFARQGAKIGSALRIRLPNDYIVGTGKSVTPQGTNEVSTTMTLATQKNVTVAFGSAERTLSLDDYSERVLAPAVNNLAGAVALDLMSVALSSVGMVYNPGSGGAIQSPTAGTFLLAGAILDQASAPKKNRQIMLDPMTQARTITTLAGLFNPQVKISEQYESGEMSRDTLGFDWNYDQTILKPTTGTCTGFTVNGANQTGNTLVVNAITGTLNIGDVITLAGVNSSNRITKQDNGTLAQFVLTAAAANGATSLSIYPSITPPLAGVAVQYQTVTASPANGAAGTPVLPAATQYRKNLAYYPEAFTMATADLETPQRGVVEVARESYDDVSMRMITAYDVLGDNLITRLDILYGYLAVRPEWSTTVADIL